MSTCPKCGSRMKYVSKLGYAICPQYKYHKEGVKANTIKQKKNIEVQKMDFEAFIPSAQQQLILEAVLEAIKDDTISAVETIARAGTGKTTTLMWIIYTLLKMYPDLKIGYIAFGSKAAAEAKDKAPKADDPTKLNIGTFHSLMGMQPIQAKYPSSKVNSAKTFELAKKVIPIVADFEEERARKFVRTQTIKLADWLVGQMVEIGDIDSAISAMENLDLIVNPEDAFKLIQHSLSEIDQHMSFTDMLSVVYTSNIKIPHFDILFVDESQDLNLMQQVVCLLATGYKPQCAAPFNPKYEKKRGVLAYVGDTEQSIFLFRGALLDGLGTFYDMSCERGDVLTTHLTQTRRCPKAVVRLAQQIVPDFQALDDAPEGDVQIVGSDTILEHCNTGRDDTVIIARTNAGLVPLALKLVNAGVPVYFLSRDLGEDLLSLISQADYKASKDEAKLTVSALIRWIDGQEELLLSKKKLSNGDRIRLDKLDTLKVLIKECTSIHDAIILINKLFNTRAFMENPNAIWFSTVHAFKGNERRYVILTDTLNFPHPLAEGEDEEKQERNMFYVAITRAQEILMIENDYPPILKGFTS